MTISSTKCTQFAVKEQFSRTGKSEGHAVVGKAEPHHRAEPVKHDGAVLTGLTQVDAENHVYMFRQHFLIAPEADGA